MEFPRFNLSKFENATGVQRRYFSEALDTICSETGFVILEGHDVPEEMIEQQWSVINHFFSAPTSIKEKVKVVTPMVGLALTKRL
jgi:isopenicillin N synthase-like dioxygenase